MKLTNETIFTSSIIIGLTGLLYSYMGLHRKVKSLDEGVNLIMSTHLLYMENRDAQTEQIKSINETLEAIALSTPFRGTGWQTKFVEAKIAREIDSWKSEGEHQELYESFKTEPKFYDDEPTEAGV
jgi:hypothetical protein